VRPVTTVAVPAHGPAEQVLPLLRALSAQADPAAPLPVIVSDDASPAPLAPALEGAGLPGLVLTVVRSERNAGPGAARNRALERVTTPWVSFLDADEVPAGDWLARLLAHLGSPEPADVVTGIVRMPADPSPFEHATEVAVDAEQFGAGNITFRTERLRAAGGFDERYYDAARKLHFREDADLRFRLEARGLRLAYDPGLVVEHPPLAASFWTQARLARRYYFDPLLSREHPARFRRFVRSRRVGPVPLRRARHDAALLYAGGLALGAAGAVTRSRGIARAGACAATAGWAANLGALAWRRRLRPGHVPGLAVLAAVVPLVYLWHFARGVLRFRHLPRF
jgi:glycosyltransferase involved in cell wall biosynthesis